MSRFQEIYTNICKYNPRMQPVGDFSGSQCAALQSAIITRLSYLETSWPSIPTTKTIVNATKLALFTLDRSASPAPAPEATALARAIGSLAKAIEAHGNLFGAWNQCGEHNTYFDPFPTFRKHIEDYLREQAEIEAKNNEILADFGYKVDRHGALAYLDGTVVSDSEDEEPTGSDAKSAALG